MDWLQFGVQWLHVLLGIFWFGNAIAVAAILIPAISTLPIPTQRQVGGRFADVAGRTFERATPASGASPSSSCWASSSCSPA